MTAAALDGRSACPAPAARCDQPMGPGSSSWHRRSTNELDTRRLEEGETLGVVRGGRLVAWIQPRAGDSSQDKGWTPAQHQSIPDPGGSLL